MAILNEVPGIKVAVRIGHQDAVEYDDPEPLSDDNVPYPISNKYIECVDGAEFSIRYKAGKGYNWETKDQVLRYRTYVDGQYISGNVFRWSHRDGSHFVKGKISMDPKTHQHYLHRCKFSAITTVDDAKQERIKEDVKRSKHLGLIEVQIHRGTIKSQTPPLNPYEAIETSNLEIAAKALKGRAISHGLTLSPKEVTRAKETVHFNVHPEDGDRPIAVFRFHYRSKESLRQELIIPRSPSNSPAPSISEMPRAELERLARERLDQIRVKSRVKDEVKQEPCPIIKREVGEIYDLTQDTASSPRAKRVKRETIVVDLTDD